MRGIICREIKIYINCNFQETKINLKEEEEDIS